MTGVRASRRGERAASVLRLSLAVVENPRHPRGEKVGCQGGRNAAADVRRAEWSDQTTIGVRYEKTGFTVFLKGRTCGKGGDDANRRLAEEQANSTAAFVGNMDRGGQEEGEAERQERFRAFSLSRLQV